MSLRILTGLALLAAAEVFSANAFPPEPLTLLEAANETVRVIFGLEGNNTKVLPLTAEWTYTPSTGSGSNYYVYTWPVMDQNSAKLFCESLIPGMQLLSVETEGELQFLRTKLHQFTVTRYNQYGFWVAGTDLIVTNQRGAGQYWYYTGVTIDITFWNQGEPNNKDSATRGIETCVDLKVPVGAPEAGFRLNDEVCTSELSYICEKHHIA